MYSDVWGKCGCISVLAKEPASSTVVWCLRFPISGTDTAKANAGMSQVNTQFLSGNIQLVQLKGLSRPVLNHSGLICACS